MTADPFREILVLLALTAGYGILIAGAWLVLFRKNRRTVHRLNAALARRRAEGRCELPPDLAATLSALVAERRLPLADADRLRRAAPVFHRGRWAVYPSNAYWAHRLEQLDLRGAL